MTRQEYNEYRYIAANLRKWGTSNGITCTIKTSASADYKQRLDRLYSVYNMHPASIRVDSHYYDDNERIIYIYGRFDRYTDYYGREYDWKELFSAENLARFGAALTDEWRIM